MTPPAPRSGAGSRRGSSAGQPPARFGVVTEALSRPMADWYLVLVSSLLLVALGALMVLSSSSVYAEYSTVSGDPYYFIKHQLIFLVLGLPLAAWLAFQNEAMLKVLGWVAFLGSLVLLLAVFIPGVGTDQGKGNLAWIDVGVATIQPSEFSKLGLIMWSAALLSSKERLIDRPKELLPLGLGFVVVEILILAEKDLGTALVVGAIMFAVLWAIGVPGRMLLALCSAALVAVALLVVTSPNRMHRIGMFLSGKNDPNSSQQPLAAIYGMASGGWWGLGLGGSRQKWGNLNDGAQNDFVFAVIGEELGLMGSIVVLSLFAVLGYAGLRIAMRSESLFCRVLAVGATSWIMFQGLVNMGVAMKLLPVVGVPLPFISYGGSALFANILAVGALLACARHEPAARAALARRRTKGGEPRPRVTTVVDAGR